MDIAPRRLTVTVAQASGILGLSAPSIWALLANGRLESININKRRLVLWTSIEELVESRRGVPGDARRNGAVPALGSTPGKRNGKSSLDLATPIIEGLGLSTRTKNALINDHVRTVQDLASKSKRELLLIPNFGKICLAEVQAMLAKHGLHLAAPTE